MDVVFVAAYGRAEVLVYLRSIAYYTTHGTRRGRGMVMMVVLDNPLGLRSKKIVG